MSAALVKAAPLDMELSVSIYFARSQVERSKAISALSQAFSTVADDDLTVDLGEMPESFIAIKRDFEHAISRIRELVAAMTE